MQFSDRLVHFPLQLLYSTLRYPNPWTLATFCIGTYTLYNLFTYWYSARFCQGNARRRTFFQVKNSIDFSVSFYNYHEPSIYPCL